MIKIIDKSNDIVSYPTGVTITDESPNFFTINDKNRTPICIVSKDEIKRIEIE